MALAGNPRTIDCGQLSSATGQTRGNPQARWQETALGHPYRGRQIYPASHRANHQRRMGTPLPPQQLWVPPRTLGASCRAASTGGNPRRICTGGRHRHGRAASATILKTLHLWQGREMCIAGDQGSTMLEHPLRGPLPRKLGSCSALRGAIPTLSWQAAFRRCRTPRG